MIKSEESVKEKIEKMYEQALYDDLPPNLFADQVLLLFSVDNSISFDQPIFQVLDIPLSNEKEYIPTDQDCINAIKKQLSDYGFETLRTNNQMKEIVKIIKDRFDDIWGAVSIIALFVLILCSISMIGLASLMFID